MDPSPTEPMQAPQNSRRALIVLAVVAVLALGGYAAISWLRPGDAEPGAKSSIGWRTHRVKVPAVTCANVQLRGRSLIEVRVTTDIRVVLDGGKGGPARTITPAEPAFNNGNRPVELVQLCNDSKEPTLVTLAEKRAS